MCIINFGHFHSSTFSNAPSSTRALSNKSCPTLISLFWWPTEFHFGEHGGELFASNYGWAVYCDYATKENDTLPSATNSSDSGWGLVSPSLSMLRCGSPIFCREPWLQWVCGCSGQATSRRPASQRSCHPAHTLLLPCLQCLENQGGLGVLLRVEQRGLFKLLCLYIHLGKLFTLFSSK